MSYNEVNPITLGKTKRKRERKRKRPGAHQALPVPLDLLVKLLPKSSVEAQIPGWPASLKQFVTTGFARSEAELSPEEQNMFSSQITKIVDLALKKNMIWMNDWERQTLPVFDGGELNLVSVVDPVGPVYTAESSESSPVPGNASPQLNGGYASKLRKKQRLERFNSPELDSPSPSRQPVVSYAFSNDNEETFAPVQGTCQQIEKSYFRLTSEPIPSNVRPQEVLEKSWKFVLNKYRHGQPYTYFISQFKSIRQDLTVQHIKNDFTIHIYEVNARVCLEMKDLGEFNQCQAQLTYLYDYLREYSNRDKYLSQELEFIAYRVIYMIILRNYQDVTKLKLLILTGKYSKLKIAFDGQENFLNQIHNLFRISDCMLLGDYYNLFRLVLQLKNDLPLGFELLDTILLVKERIKTLYVVSKAYRKLNSEYVRDTILSLDPKQYAAFLDKHGLRHCIMGADFDCTQARPVLLAIVSQPSFNRVDIKGQI